MQEIEYYPRYLAHQLRTHLPVTVVGRLVEINSKRTSLLIEADPEAKLIVQGLVTDSQELNRYAVGKYYELRGLCRSGKEVQVHGSTCFGSDFDMASYNQMLGLATKQFRSLFSS